MILEFLNNFEPITAGISAFIAGGISFLFTRRKYNTEVDQAKIQNMQSKLDFYDSNYDHNTKVLRDLQVENEQIRNQNKELKIQLNNYEIENASLKKLIDELTKRVEALEKKNKSNGVKVKKNSKKV